MLKRQSCLDCAFLRDPDEPGDPAPSASESLREALEKGCVSAVQKLQCYKTVWGPETIDGAISEEMTRFLKEDRGKDCFFFRYRRSIRCCVAATLEKRREGARTVKEAAVIGVVGALLGTILGAALTAMLT